MGEPEKKYVRSSSIISISMVKTYSCNDLFGLIVQGLWGHLVHLCHLVCPVIGDVQFWDPVCAHQPRVHYQERKKHKKVQGFPKLLLALNR